MSKHSLLIELGTEELPPKALKKLAESFRDGIVSGLASHALDHGDVHWFATPRRLAVLIDNCQSQAPDKHIEALGPPADKAKDDAGNWTPAAAGFARKQGIAPEALEVADTPKGARLCYRSSVKGATLADEISGITANALAGLPIPKRMRWGASRAEFVRPVHWLVIMADDEVIGHDTVLGLTPGRTTFGHRFHHPDAVTLEHANTYSSALHDAYVMADFTKRQDLIKSQVQTQADSKNAQAVIEQDLLDEVTALVEWPVALMGNFEERFLSLPAQALISSMKEHQKYFHVVDGNGDLLPHFITVSNIESRDPAQVIQGNERVIRPRLSDAVFFFDTDRQIPLIERLPALDKVVFQQQLGSIGDKTRRVAQLAALLAAKIGADASQSERAGMLAKADLVTNMVGEFPDLQGIAGRQYALNDGEAPEVAQAIEEHYLPRNAGDVLPSHPVSTCVALADRLDTVIGIFGIGQMPTGSKDPFALRRASVALLRIIVEGSMSLDLLSWLKAAAAQYPQDAISEDAANTAFAYIVERFRAWFEDENIPAEVFKSVEAKGLTQPLNIQQRVHAVARFTELPEAASLAAANKRVGNILSKLDSNHEFSQISDDLLTEPAEQALAKAIAPVKTKVEQLAASGDYTAAMQELAVLQAPVDAFFNDVMVMSDDEAVRHNRLNLLYSLQSLFTEIADISQLVVAKT